MTERMSAKQFKAEKLADSKPAKYRNKKVQLGGLRFDSKREAARYQVLKAREAAGEISHLELQPRFKLRCGDRPVTFDSGRQAVYVADFAYFDGEKRIVEDAKGFRTPEYKLKRAIVHAMHPAVKIIEV